MQNVAAVVLDTVEQLIIRVFDQLGGRRLVRTAVTGSYSAAQESFNALPVYSMRCRSTAVLNPHQALAAYSNLATTTAR